MASFAEQERSALHGLAVPGRHGRAGDDRPRDRGAHRHCVRQRHRETRQALRADQRGQHRLRRRAARWAAPRHARRRHVRRHRPGSMDRERRRHRRPPASPRRCARASARSRRSSDQSDSRLVLRLSGPRVRDVLAKGVPVDLHPKAFKPGDVAMHAGRATSACRSICWTMRRPISSPRRAAWRAASGRGSRHPPAEFGYDVVTQ